MSHIISRLLRAIRREKCEFVKNILSLEKAFKKAFLKSFFKFVLGLAT